MGVCQLQHRFLAPPGTWLSGGVAGPPPRHWVKAVAPGPTWNLLVLPDPSDKVEAPKSHLEPQLAVLPPTSLPESAEMCKFPIGKVGVVKPQTFHS